MRKKGGRRFLNLRKCKCKRISTSMWRAVSTGPGRGLVMPPEAGSELWDRAVEMGEDHMGQFLAGELKKKDLFLS